MRTRVFLDVLLDEEKRVRRSLNRMAAPRKDTGGAELEAANTFRDATEVVLSLHGEDIDAAVIGLRHALIDSFTAAQHTLEKIAQLKIAGLDFGEIVREIATERVDEEEQSFARSTGKEIEEKIALGYSATIKAKGPMPVECQSTASLSTSMSRLASAKESLQGRDRARKHVKEVLVQKFPQLREREKILDDLAAMRDSFITWRIGALYALGRYPKPESFNTDFVHMQNRRDTRDWQLCFDAVQRLQVRKQSMEKALRDELAAAEALCHYHLGRLGLAANCIEKLQADEEFSKNGDVMVLKSRVLLAQGQREQAEKLFSDCLNKERLGADKRMRRWLQQHEQEARLGQIACAAASGGKERARQAMFDLLYENSKADCADDELYEYLRSAVPDDPEKKSGLLGLISTDGRILPLSITFVVKRDFWDDDVEINNCSDYALTRVKATVWTEKKDGTRTGPYEKSWDQIGKGQTKSYEITNLVTNDTLRVWFSLYCRQGRYECEVTEWR